MACHIITFSKFLILFITFHDNSRVYLDVLTLKKNQWTGLDRLQISGAVFDVIPTCSDTWIHSNEYKIDVVKTIKHFGGQNSTQLHVKIGHLIYTSSRHCLWHIWQYHRNFCSPFAFILFAIALGVNAPAFSLPIS